jgi:hypothetical protein
LVREKSVKDAFDARSRGPFGRSPWAVQPDRTGYPGHIFDILPHVND